MGSACCTAVREKDVPIRAVGNTLRPSVRCSPSWSFRWENRRRVAGEIDDFSNQTSRGLSTDNSLEIKGRFGSDKGNFSDGGSLHDSFGSPISIKSMVSMETGPNLVNQSSESADMSIESKYPMVKGIPETTDVGNFSAPKVPLPVDLSFPSPPMEPLRTCSHMIHRNSTPSRRVRVSPGHPLLRQISDSQILGLKSPNGSLFSEGRASCILSTSSRELAVGSQGGSSDGWSMRTFSELVASSQRERWSFDSEHLGMGFGKISGCSSRFSCSPSDVQTCGVCVKSLTEKTSWSCNDLAAVAVLVCGHVYHAECLESITLEGDMYDPSCPVCEQGDKQISKISRKALKAEVDLKANNHKMFRNVDQCVRSNSNDFYLQKHAIGTSSCAASSSLKPSLLRHFSFGSRWGGSLSDDNAKKKGFWSKYRKA